MFSIFNGRTSFYQWDVDQKLIINCDIPDYQVHFENTSDEVCYTLEPYEMDGKTVVNVPNLLLQNSTPIIVWCYVLDKNGNYTIKSKTFAVIERQKPSDYVYTETEVLSFNSKLDKNVGAENAGKALIVGEDGNIVFEDTNKNSDAVLYTKQNLTAAQQEQARANINASSNYARECSHLWFVRDNGEHYRDIVTAARSGGNPVVIRESDLSGTTFIAPAIAVIGDYGSQNPSVPYPITIFSADGTMWFTEIYNLYGKYLTTPPRMTELRRIDTAETDVLHVTLTTGNDNVATSDTTAAAVQEALAAGKVVTVTSGDRANVWLLLSAVEGATTGSYDMQLVSALGVMGVTANGTQWTGTFASFGGLATMDAVYAGAVSLGGMHGAAAGQIVKIAEVDDNGTPLAWEPVDMPSGGGAETWEEIAEIVIPEGADEATALTINKDSDGNPFSLVKARLCAKFPKYTGATTIPKFSFAMLNGKTTGRVTPLAYTSVWPKVSASFITGTVYEIDVSGAQQIEHVIKSGNLGWPDDSGRDYVVYGEPNQTDTTWFADTLWAKPITSIGGTGMLIYPGCRFVLYGVRA